MDWVTIMVFTSPNEAYIAQSLVESGDIPTFLKDETVITVNNLYSLAVGGAKLQVPAAEAAQAREILVDAGYTAAAVRQPKAESFPIKNMMECPYCGSDNVYEGRRAGTVMVIGIWLVRLPRPVFKYTCHCFDCGRNWKTHL